MCEEAGGGAGDEAGGCWGLYSWRRIPIFKRVDVDLNQSSDAVNCCHAKTQKRRLEEHCLRKRH